ncbi:MAG: pyruvate ferredoxin oxidoreductase [Prevotella sp.]|nr:pyruvate ferredoxin oxidoreductase [Prevotella sp.]
MDYKYIEQLLERYFEAQTTLKEEEMLKTFFSQPEEELPQALQQYKPLFDAFAPEETLGDDFDERLMQLTEDTVRVKARTISMAERLKPLLRAAATVAIILTLSNALNQSFKDTGTWTDEEQFADYKAALRNAALAAAKDSTLLYSEELVMRGDSLPTDSLRGAPTGYLE